MFSRRCTASCSNSVGQAGQGAARVASRTPQTARPIFAPGLPLQDTCGSRCSSLYTRALELARGQDYQQARKVFEAAVIDCPSLTKAWVSWAQMEKRCRASSPDKYAEARQVLQRALTINPHNAQLCQAWGLLEMQRGNFWAAVMLLERCCQYDPQLQPVLRWKPVREAKMTVGSRLKRRELQ